MGRDFRFLNASITSHVEDPSAQRPVNGCVRAPSEGTFLISIPHSAAQNRMGFAGPAEPAGTAAWRVFSLLAGRARARSGSSFAVQNERPNAKTSGIGLLG